MCQVNFLNKKIIIEKILGVGSNIQKKFFWIFDLPLKYGVFRYYIIDFKEVVHLLHNKLLLEFEALTSTRTWSPKNNVLPLKMFLLLDASMRLISNSTFFNELFLAILKIIFGKRSFYPFSHFIRNTKIIYWTKEKKNCYLEIQ